MTPNPRGATSRSSALIVILTCTLVSVGIRVAGLGARLPLPSGPAAVRVALGSDIRSYMRLAGDQVVEVPDGTYTGGNVAAAHPETGGPLKGWLVLVAESPYGVVVDLRRGC